MRDERTGSTPLRDDGKPARAYEESAEFLADVDAGYHDPKTWSEDDVPYSHADLRWGEAEQVLEQQGALAMARDLKRYNPPLFDASPHRAYMQHLLDTYGMGDNSSEGSND